MSNIAQYRPDQTEFETHKIISHLSELKRKKYKKKTMPFYVTKISLFFCASSFVIIINNVSFFFIFIFKLCVWLNEAHLKKQKQKKNEEENENEQQRERKPNQDNPIAYIQTEVYTNPMNFHTVLYQRTRKKTKWQK